MPARSLDGLKIRDEIFSELKSEIAKLHAQGIRPGLAAVLVGENPASQLYVKSKIAACEQLGLASWMHTPPASVSTDYMLQLVRDLNADDNVDGILIQLPLPAQIDSKRVLESVDPANGGEYPVFHPEAQIQVTEGNVTSGIDATLERIASVEPIQPGGSLTAATASQLCDGASGVLVMNENALKVRLFRARQRVLKAYRSASADGKI